MANKVVMISENYECKHMFYKQNLMRAAINSNIDIDISTIFSNYQWWKLILVNVCNYALHTGRSVEKRCIWLLNRLPCFKVLIMKLLKKNIFTVHLFIY